MSARVVLLPLVSLTWLALLGSPVAPPLAAQTSASVPIAVSTFDHDDEGWTTVFASGQVIPPRPSYTQQGGNPDGYIYATDNNTGPVWYWQAPAKFLGDVGAAYQRALQFDLQESHTSSPNADPLLVVLAGAGITLVFDAPYLPQTEWTRYSILLSETAGWKHAGTNQAATQAEMQAVLSSLTTLKIRGEYQFGIDVTGLDNVLLGADPLPASDVYLPLIAY